MELLTLISRPLVGAIIGYITNDIAIRMLFRPHTAKQFLGIHVPFTPGIIPKEKGRIAASVGTAISDNLMNKDVLEKNLLSDEMLDKIRNAITDFFDEQHRNSETLRQFLCHYIRPEEVDAFIERTDSQLTSQIYEKLADTNIGTPIAHIAVDYAMKKMQHFGSDIGDAFKEDGIGKGGGLGDMIGRGIQNLFGSKAKDSTSEFIKQLSQPVEQQLSKTINEILKNNSKEIVGNLIGQEITRIASMPMKEILSEKGQQINDFTNSALSLYRSIITNYLPRILQNLDISHIIEQRINEMDVNESEKIILSVMNKELKSIVWLGALLGFLMGCVNLLF